MRRKKQGYLRGRYSHRRTEDSYLGALLDAVTPDDWRDVVTTAVEAAKSGDASARAWLGQYLMGKPGGTAPTPTTVIVQQLSGSDPVVDRLARPYIDRARYPASHADDGLIDSLKAAVAAEMQEMQIEGASEIKNGAVPPNLPPSEAKSGKTGG